MDDSCFNLAYQGTRLEDCLNVKNLKQENIIVIDTNEVYGSTFDGVEQLKKSNLVSDIEVFKNNGSFLIEAIPMFLRPKGRLVNELCGTNANTFCDFITIDHHFLILEDSKYYKIPYTKTQLVDTVYFNFKERHLINKFIRGEIGVSELRNLLSDKTKRILFNGIVGNQLDYEQCLQDYFSNFGCKPFLYPKHGFKDLSEVISRSNAMCGTAYLLSSEMKIYSISVNETENSLLNDENKEIECCQLNEGANLSQYSDSIGTSKNATTSTGSESLSESWEDPKELLDRYSSLKYTTDDSDEYEEGGSDNDYTGKIKPTINSECCKDKKNNGCFNALSCNEEERDCRLNGHVYNPDIISQTKALSLKEMSRESKQYNFKEGKENIVVNLTEIVGENLCVMNDSMTSKMDLDNNLIGRTDDSSALVDVIPIDLLLQRAKEGYKVLITTSLGNVFAKRMIRQCIKSSNTYVRVLLLNEKLIENKFFAYFFNGNSFIQVMGIDSSSKCCPEGTYIVYLVKDNSKVDERDLNILKIHNCNVISDVSFKATQMHQTSNN